MAVPGTRLVSSDVREVDLPAEESGRSRTLHGRDHEAEFDRLYTEYSVRVVGLIRKFTTDEDQIDDIVQETFLRAYNAGLHLECIEESGDERSQWPWLAAVARNLSLDMLRKRKAVVEDEIDDELIDFGLSLDDPEVRYLASRRREGIVEALSEMCPRQRRLLILKHVQGVGYVDLARREGISVEALKSVVARARRTFKQTYAAIAEHHGLGVATGGVLAAGRARLRSLRDRVLGAPDALNAAAAGSPALGNTLVSLTVLGAVGVVGAIAGDVAGANREPTPIVSEAPASVPATGYEPAALPEATTVEVVTVEPQAVAVGVAPEADSASAGGSTGEDSGDASASSTEAATSVGTDDLVDESPAGMRAGAQAGVEPKDEGDTLIKHDQSLDTDPPENPVIGEDDADAGSVGSVGWYCAPPEERGVTSTVVCTALSP